VEHRTAPLKGLWTHAKGGYHQVLIRPDLGTQAIEKFPALASPALESRRRIADLMSYLVSPAEKWMTGASVRMDGSEIKGI
jgi:hypothetical protein